MHLFLYPFLLLAVQTPDQFAPPQPKYQVDLEKNGPKMNLP